MTKNKIIARIIACVLIVVLVLGFLIPVVSATEIEDGPKTNAQQNQEDEKPTQLLPDGFEYVQIDGEWVVQRTPDNTAPSIMIDAPDGFDTSMVTVFIGNVQTHDVTYYNLYSLFGYVTDMALPDGYYVIFSNGYAWSDADGNAYAINGGEYQYVYVGNDYDPDLYGVQFQTDNEIIKIEMVEANSDMRVIGYNNNFMVNSFLLKYPESAKLEPIDDEESTPPSTETEHTPIEPGETIQKPGVSGGKSTRTLLDIFFDAIKDSAIILIIIAVCFVGLKIISVKKKIDTEKQMGEDGYDDKHIE